MVQVVHSVGAASIAKDVADPIFLLTNGKGSTLSLGTHSTSRYQGGFFNSKFEVFKVVENIHPAGASSVTSLINRFWCVERKRGNLTESFFLPSGHPAIVYELSSPQEIQLDLDCRKLFDFRQFGRHYAVKEENGYTIITFTKQTDSREDAKHSKKEFRLFVVLNRVGFKHLHQFVPVSYAYDDERGTQPHERYIYQAGTVKTDRLIISFGTDRRKAIKDNEQVARRLAVLKRDAQKLALPKIRDRQLQFASFAAGRGVQSLVQEIGAMKGIYAGLYWFPQFWARDELISLKALMHAGKYPLVKELLWKHLHHITVEGYLPNRVPSADLKSADAAGWLWKRVADFISFLDQKKLLNRYLTTRDRMFLKRQLRQTIVGIKNRHMQNGLVVNGNKETWIDTEWGGEVRSGARIEIQAAYLHMLNLMGTLCGLTGDKRGKATMALQERSFAQKVRKAFWTGTALKDGSDDATMRPNVFLAYYLYPPLLTDTYWKSCFTAALEKLWNDWGGLSTIDKGHPLFCAQYTGENNRSYHRGDSWYWVNNLAAIALRRADPEKFAPYVKRILDASTYELLWSGIVGYSAELSSSARLESKGCLAQAWSMGMYLELVEEIGKH